MSIVIEKLSHAYHKDTWAIKDISCTLEAGNIYGLIGMNGSGKSTLFNCLMGMLTPTQGHIQINHQAIQEARKKQRIAYVPQNEMIDWDFPVLVEEVVMMGRYGHMAWHRIPKERDHEKVRSALDAVAMTPFMKRQIGELSGGQKKRVFVARALAQEADIILLDEPFTGVDTQTENHLISLFRGLKNQHKLLLISTHNLGSVPELCDQVLLINQRLLAQGPIKSTFTKANLNATFQDKLRALTIASEDIHDDADADQRSVAVLTDDEKPLVFYGEKEKQHIVHNKDTHD